MKLAVIFSRYNEEIVGGLKHGVFEVFAERGLSRDQIVVIEAPGAFELPLLAQEAAATGKFSGVICLGCVIKGDTAHFEFISLGVAMGIQQASLKTGVPIAFGVLTTYDEAQAALRSKPGLENKGREAATACLDAIRSLVQIRESASSVQG